MWVHIRTFHKRTAVIAWQPFFPVLVVKVKGRYVKYDSILQVSWNISVGNL